MPYALSPLLQQRAAQELAQIDTLLARHVTHIALVSASALQAEEPLGVERLQKLVEA